MCRTLFYLSVALLAFGIGLFCAISFLKKDNLAIEIMQDTKINAQLINEEKLSISVEITKNPKDKLTCKDENLLLIWNQLKNDENFDEDWANHLLAFGVDDCIKAYNIEKIVDLNQDGSREIIVRGNNLADCTGSGNCSLAVFEKKDKEFKFILKESQIQKIDLTKTRTNGYQDIKLRTWNTGFEYYVQIFKHNGKDYQANNCWFETNQIMGNFLKKPKISFVKCGSYDYVN
jgi:hypothetical protein